MNITESSTVELFPVYIKPNGFKSQIVGLGSKRSVLMSADETVALRLLRKNPLLSKASAQLREHNAHSRINFAKLVKQLADAGLVHRIDSQELEEPYAPRFIIVLDGVRRLLMGLPVAAAGLLQFLGSRVLPIHSMISINTLVLYLLFLKRRKRGVDRIRQGMQRLLTDRTSEELDRLSTRAYRNSIRSKAELILLQVAPDDRIRAWVPRSMMDYEIQPLMEALESGKGAIVFHYHMGPIQYVSMLLSALGFKVTLLGMSLARPQRTRMYFSVVDDLGPAGVLKLLRTLQKGEVVLIAPDPDIHPIDTGGAREAKFRELFAGSWEKGSRLAVPFLSYQVWAYLGLAWLHEKSGAPLIFSSVERLENGRVSFQCKRFSPPERQGLSEREWRQRTMDLIYRRYEEALLRRPEQWGHWISFFRDVHIHPSAQSSLVLRAQTGEPREIKEASIVRTFSLLPVRFKEEQWLVIRMGTSGVILTSTVGLKALRMFRRGASVREVKARIGQDEGLDPEAVNLESLLIAATSAGMVKSVDGTPVRAPSAYFRRWLLHLFKVTLYPGLYAVVDNLFPLRSRESLLLRLQWHFEGRFTHLLEKERVLSNLKILFPHEPSANLEMKVRDFHQQKLRSNLAFLATRKKDVGPILKWLDTFLERDIVGEDRFRQCCAQRKGVIVPSFHFGLYWMMPALLLRMGLRVHVLIGSLSQKEEQMEGMEIPGYPGARLTFHRPSLRSLAELPDLLSRGDVVLLFADTHGGRESELHQFVHHSWGKAAFAKTDFSLLGHPFPVEAGVVWLHRNSGAPIMPAVLYSAKNTLKVRLEFGQPLTVDKDASGNQGNKALPEETVISGVYGQLESWVRRLPEQWAYVSSFPGQSMPGSLRIHHE